MKIIAHIHTDFPTKFGIPRQSGLAKDLEATVVFEKEYRDAEALRGIEAFSHLWLIWNFSENGRESRSLTVRPPRLGGNKRMGVFASRSPFRPNPIGLSCVRLVRLEKTEGFGTVLIVSGADLMDNTPIYDIKPYLPFTDCQPQATGGFSDEVFDYELEVSFPEELLALVPEGKRSALLCVLKNDPRPAYQTDENRVYGFGFAGLEIKFTVSDNTLTVRQIITGAVAFSADRKATKK